MSLRDRDLLSIQEARELVTRASEAQKTFAKFSQEQVDAVVDACAQAASSAADTLARLAVEETGYGNVPDKVIKNRLGSVAVLRAIRGIKTVGILSEDRAKGLIEVAVPVGVVAAIIPSTNPTSTAIYKTLISLKARNGIVLSPHPSAMRCICETVDVMTRAAMHAGAPEGLIGCLRHSTMPGTQELMRHPRVGVILATGGAGLVRAAYSSGKPAFGVGPGNVPAYIERTAYVPKAVADIIAGKTLDYGTICSSEQSIIVDEAIREEALEQCRQQGAYFLSADEIRAVGEMVIAPGSFAPNPKIVGRPATTIAEMAGIKVPPHTRVLIAQLKEVGREHPLSLEKLSPILAFYSVADTAAAIELCIRLLHLGGLGHTIAIHSNNDAAIREFGQAVPAFRVCVNTSAVHGSIGYSTNLFPAMTLGCGALGGNITSDNIGPLHLINIKRIAFESRPIEHRTVPAEQRMLGAIAAEAAAPKPAAAEKVLPAKAPAAASGTSAPGAPPSSAPKPMVSAPTAPVGQSGVDRQMIAHIVERVFAQHSIPRGAGISATGSAVTDAGSTSSAGRATESKLTAKDAAVVAFVSENDVRIAITREQKIHIGPKTIVTPSARDLALEHGIFVETPAGASGANSTKAAAAE